MTRASLRPGGRMASAHRDPPALRLVNAGEVLAGLASLAGSRAAGSEGNGIAACAPASCCGSPTRAAARAAASATPAPSWCAVLDPACGSAHLLVEVVDELADKIAEEGGIEDTALLKRLVLKRCVYGVDLSPMGAEIARSRCGWRASCRGRRWPTSTATSRSATP